MKVIILYYLILSVVAKNVFDIGKFNLQAEKAERGIQNDEPEKRDGKNVVNLDNFRMGVPTKREADPKNVFNVKKLGGGKVKRDAEPKNVFNFKAFGGGHTKRDQAIFDGTHQSGDETSYSSKLLTSVLPQFKTISIFSGYIRDNEALSERAAKVDESMLIICPTDDSIINKLNNMKPWEFPKSLNGENDDEIIASNLNYFLSNHIVDNLQDLKVESANAFSVELLSGKPIKIIQNLNDFELIVDEKKIKVEMARQVENGYIFIIDDCLVKP